jgi:hypothetical protein
MQWQRAGIGSACILEGGDQVAMCEPRPSQPTTAVVAARHATTPSVPGCVNIMVSPVSPGPWRPKPTNAGATQAAAFVFRPQIASYKTVIAKESIASPAASVRTEITGGGGLYMRARAGCPGTGTGTGTWLAAACACARPTSYLPAQLPLLTTRDPPPRISRLAVGAGAGAGVPAENPDDWG